MINRGKMSNDLKAIFNKQKREENIAKLEKYIQANEQKGFTEKQKDFLDIQKFATDDRGKALDNFLKAYDEITFTKLKHFAENHQDCVFIRNDGQGYYTKAMIVSLNDESHLVLYEDVEFQTLQKMDLYEFINEFTISMCK